MWRRSRCSTWMRSAGTLAERPWCAVRILRADSRPVHVRSAMRRKQVASIVAVGGSMTAGSAWMGVSTPYPVLLAQHLVASDGLAEQAYVRNLGVGAAHNAIVVVVVVS